MSAAATNAMLIAFAGRNGDPENERLGYAVEQRAEEHRGSRPGVRFVTTDVVAVRFPGAVDDPVTEYVAIPRTNAMPMPKPCDRLVFGTNSYAIAPSVPAPKLVTSPALRVRVASGAASA